MLPLELAGIAAFVAVLVFAVRDVFKTDHAQEELRETHTYSIQLPFVIRDYGHRAMFIPLWIEWDQVEWWPGEIWGLGEE